MLDGYKSGTSTVGVSHELKCCIVMELSSSLPPPTLLVLLNGCFHSPLWSSLICFTTETLVLNRYYCYYQLASCGGDDVSKRATTCFEGLFKPSLFYVMYTITTMIGTASLMGGLLRLVQ